MATLSDNLTQSETWYRDHFQRLWQQAEYRAEQLHIAYEALRLDKAALDTREAESIARDLAQTEAQKANFYADLEGGLRRRERDLQAELAEAKSLGAPLSRIEQLQASLQSIQDADIGLSAASIGWRAPALNSYSANGRTFSNDGAVALDTSTITGKVQYLWQEFTGAIGERVNTVSNVLELVTPRPADQAALRWSVIDEGNSCLISGLNNICHGSGFLDFPGFIHFIPKVNDAAWSRAA